MKKGSSTKTRILNDLLVAADTDIVYNHDVDVVLPKKSYEIAYNAIKNQGVDCMYPFGAGVYQWVSCKHSGPFSISSWIPTLTLMS